MTIGNGAVGLFDIQTEFGGTNPAGIFEYYQGGPYIGAGVYAPNGPIPTSGAINVLSFRGASATRAYYGLSSNNYVYSANYGFSLDYFNGALRLTIGYWGSGANSTSWTQLQYYTGTAATAQYSEIVQIPLTSANANVIQYATGASGFVKHPCNCIFSNPIYAYGQNIAAQTGQGTPVGPAPGAAWMAAARWNGTNSVTVYLNAGRNGTGDTGTSISMNNLGQAFGQFAGSYQVIVGYTKSGQPIYETRYYTDFTFTF